MSSNPLMLLERTNPRERLRCAACDALLRDTYHIRRVRNDIPICLWPPKWEVEINWTADDCDDYHLDCYKASKERKCRNPVNSAHLRGYKGQESVRQIMFPDLIPDIETHFRLRLPKSIESMTMKELRKELVKRDCSSSGTKKKQLVDRLRGYMNYGLNFEGTHHNTKRLETEEATHARNELARAVNAEYGECLAIGFCREEADKKHGLDVHLYLKQIVAAFHGPVTY